MAGIARTGKYGTYYVRDRSKKQSEGSLNQQQLEANALYIYKYLRATDQKWTLEGVSGLLGNIQAECGIDPEVSESLGSGFGLIQWTPGSIHSDWCNNHGYAGQHASMDSQLAHIVDEVNNNTSWYVKTDKNTTYSEKYLEFAQSTKTPEYLACCFAWNRERSGVVLYGFHTKLHSRYCNPDRIEISCRQCYEDIYGKAAAEEQAERNRESEVRSKRGGFARQWYKYLSATHGAFSGTSTNEYDISYEFGVHKGLLNDQNRNLKLTTHLTLGMFGDSSKKHYAYSDKTVELLEKLIVTYRDSIDQNSPINTDSISAYRPSSGGDMHEKGAAVDISFRTKDGSLFDHRYIAIAARKIGFTGIAPMHKNGSPVSDSTSNSHKIHLDTRGDYRAAGGTYNNSLYYGFELDSNNDGWYETAPSISKVGFKTFEDLYKITEEDFNTVMGTAYDTMDDSYSSSDEPTPPILISPLTLDNLTIRKITSDSVTISVKISGQSINSLTARIDDSIDDYRNIPLTPALGNQSYTITNLSPGNTYTLVLIASNAESSTTSARLTFTMLEAYPEPVKSVTIQAISDNLKDTKFKVVVEGPSSDGWGYWQKTGNAYGYRVFMISDHRLISYTDDASRNKNFIVTPKNKGIGFENNFQVGVSTWVTDNTGKKIFSLDDGGEFPVCSNSVCLKNKTDVPDKWFLVKNDNIYKLMPYIQTGLIKTFKALKTFKIK